MTQHRAAVPTGALDDLDVADSVHAQVDGDIHNVGCEPLKRKDHALLPRESRNRYRDEGSGREYTQIGEVETISACRSKRAPGLGLRFHVQTDDLPEPPRPINPQLRPIAAVAG
jgi:hypothetical protein